MDRTGSNSAPLITIIILSCNRKEDLHGNLLILLPYAHEEGHEIVVVDNGSTDGTVPMLELLATEWPGLRLVAHPSNVGICEGRNSGFRVARGRYIMCFDDDAVTDPRHISRLPSLFEEYPKAGILSFAVRHPVTGVYECHHGDEAKPIANFHEAGHAYKAEIFERAGYMDPGCVYGAEGLDLSIRARAHGYETVYIPGIDIDHNKKLGPRARQDDRRITWVYCFVRVIYRYFPRPLARLFAVRYTLRFIGPDIGRGRFGLAWQEIRGALRGRAEGLRIHVELPQSVLDFYNSATLRPDYGNAPLLIRFRELRAQQVSARRALQRVQRREPETPGQPAPPIASVPHEPTRSSGARPMHDDESAARRTSFRARAMVEVATDAEEQSPAA